LFADHDDGQLDAELVDAAGRVAHIALEPGQNVRVQSIARMREKFALIKNH